MSNMIDENTIEEAYNINRIYDEIRKTEEEWMNEYEDKTRFQKFIYNSKTNIDIMKNKNMSLKDKVFTIIWGA